MKGKFVSWGVFLIIVGMIFLVASGGLTFWFAGTSEGDDTAGSATIGLPGVIGWILLLGGLVLLVIGLMPSHSEKEMRRKDETLIESE